MGNGAKSTHAGQAGRVLVHICSISDALTPYATALRIWLVKHEFALAAATNASLADKLAAASACDICIVLLGADCGPREGGLCFSDCELEVSTAAALAAHKVRVFALRSAEHPLCLEQCEFVSHLKLAPLGHYEGDISSVEDLLERVETTLDPPSSGNQMYARSTTVDPQQIDAAITVLLHAAPGDDAACATLLDVLRKHAIPYRFAPAIGRLLPLPGELRRSVRDAQMVVLLEGR